MAGEPGIGKSRLTWALQQHVAQSPDAFLVRLSCSPYFVNTAFYPLIQHLERILEFGPDDTVEQRLDKIDGFLAQYGFDLPRVVPLLARLLAVPFEDRYPPLDLPADRQRQLTIDAIVKITLLRAEHQPVLFVVEDLHWADPSSLDLLTQLIEHAPQARQLLVLSFRPEFAPPWPEGPGLERLDLNRLDRDASVRVITEIAGMPVPAELLGQLVEKTDGVPLYLEELTKLVVEQGLLRHGNGRLDPVRPPPALAIPATLADSLMARLDRLTDAKGIAQLGAAIGRQFSYELLATVSETTASVDSGALRREPGPAGRRRAALRRTRSARRDLYLQARPHPGRGVRVAAADNPAGVPPAHRAGADRAVPGHGRDRARAARAPLHRGRHGRRGGAVLAARRRARTAGLGLPGGDRPPDRRPRPARRTSPRVRSGPDRSWSST